MSQGSRWPQVEIQAALDAVGVLPDPAETLVTRALEAVWSEEGRRLRLSVYVCGDAESAAVHAQFLDDAEPTDVISFPLSLESESADGDAASGELADGELVVNLECACRRSREYGNTVEAEFVLYVVHGALHLLGYDDVDDTSRATMKVAERRALLRVDLHVCGRHDDT